MCIIILGLDPSIRDPESGLEWLRICNVITEKAASFVERAALMAARHRGRGGGLGAESSSTGLSAFLVFSF